MGGYEQVREKNDLKGGDAPVSREVRVGQEPDWKTDAIHFPCFQ